MYRLHPDQTNSLASAKESISFPACEASTGAADIRRSHGAPIADVMRLQIMTTAALLSLLNAQFEDGYICMINHLSGAY